MPGSHTLLVDTLEARGLADVDFPGPSTSASANQCDSADPAPRSSADAAGAAHALRLSAPPDDVERLLQRYGIHLPQYLDLQRQRAARLARRRWPILQDRRGTGWPA
jgi:hypothetical protein